MRCLMMAIGSVFLLPGCFFAPSLAGDWEGDLDCEDIDLEIAAELDDDGGGEFSGDMEIVLDEDFVADGFSYSLYVEMVAELVLEIEGGGEQELDYDAELDDIACKLYEEGELLSSDCDEMGFDADLGTSGDFGEMTWDGADTIEIEDDGCDGELERE